MRKSARTFDTFLSDAVGKFLMTNPSTTAWYHNNRYHAQTACEHCYGVTRHEPWCSLLNSFVRYAFRIVSEPTIITIGDTLILHALGVKWVQPDAGRKGP